MVKKNFDHLDCLKKQGIFNATKAGAVLFSSNIFRIIVGFLSDVPLDTIAVVTSIEFTLNWVLEVPTGYVSDRLGRIPVALSGHFLIMFGFICVFLSLLNIYETDFNRILFVIHGICIGIGKPLISGSIEGFYQDSLVRFNKSKEKNDRIIRNSFTLGQSFGQYVTTFSFLFSLLVIYITKVLGILPYAFLFCIVYYFILIFLLYRDYKELGDSTMTPSSRNVKIKILGKKLLSSSNFKIAMIYNLLIYMILVVNAGHFVITMGRVSEISEINMWLNVVAFLFGYTSFGWILKSKLLPKLIIKLSKLDFLNICLGGITFVSTLSLINLESINDYIFVFLNFIFGTFIHLGTSGMQGVSINYALDDVEKHEYSTTLSLMNIPSFAWVALYSLYLATYRNGTPSLYELYLTTLVISLCALIAQNLPMLSRKITNDKI